MGGRAVEGTGLENRQGSAPLVGSNPTPSANRVMRGNQGARRALSGSDDDHRSPNHPWRVTGLGCQSLTLCSGVTPRGPCFWPWSGRNLGLGGVHRPEFAVGGHIWSVGRARGIENIGFFGLKGRSWRRNLWAHELAGFDRQEATDTL